MNERDGATQESTENTGTVLEQTDTVDPDPVEAEVDELEVFPLDVTTVDLAEDEKIQEAGE